MMNGINGGAHAQNSLDCRIYDRSCSVLFQGINKNGVEVFHTLKGVLKVKGMHRVA
jgi:enolase